MDEQFNRIVNVFFTGRPHFHARCSVASGGHPLVRHTDTEAQDHFASLGRNHWFNAVVGRVPLVTVCWDFTFDRDVPGDQIESYLATAKHGAKATYSYRTSYLEPETADGISGQWASSLRQDGRQVNMAVRDGGQVYTDFACRRGEQLFIAYLALNPIQGQRLSA